MIVHVTPANAKHVLTEKRLVVLCFTNNYCQPCKMAEPVIKDIARLRWPLIVVAVAEMDANEELAQSLGVDKTPTVLLLKNQKVVETIIGAGENFKTKLEAAIAAHTK